MGLRSRSSPRAARKHLRQDDSVFVMNAAYRAAMETIAAHGRTILQPVDHARFCAALDTPPVPTERLPAVFARPRETIVSR